MGGGKDQKKGMGMSRRRVVVSLLCVWVCVCSRLLLIIYYYY
jgi:hypothetical protein